MPSEPLIVVGEPTPDRASRPIRFDAANDRFVVQPRCPNPGCEALLGRRPSVWPGVGRCPTCGHVHCWVRLESAAETRVRDTALRRPEAMFCTASGSRLWQSPTDWSGPGGSATRAGATGDPDGLVFGTPHRDTEWSLVQAWRVGLEARYATRHASEVTSVSVVRGTVVTCAADGTVDAFDAYTGAARLAHPLDWGTRAFDANDPARAVRLPAAFCGPFIALASDQSVVIAEMGAALVPGAPPHRATAQNPSVQGTRTQGTRRQGAMGSAGTHVVLPAPPGLQWIGAPLACGAAGWVLTAGRVTAQGVADARVVRVRPDGTEGLDIPAPGLARVPIFTADGAVLWLDAAGGIARLPPGGTESVVMHRPDAPLMLAAAERALFCVQDGVAGPELWLADQRGGDAKLWRASLAAVLRGEPWAWAPVWSAERAGAVRGIAVAPSGGQPGGDVVVVATDLGASTTSRYVEGGVPSSVLTKRPIAPPVLTPVGYALQDANGLWLRGFSPWSFPDDNPERHVRTADRGEARLWDTSIALFGRHLYFAAGGALVCVEMVPHTRGRTV